MFKKRGVISLCFVLAALLFVGASEGAKIQLTIGGSFPGSGAYLAAGAFAAFVSREVEGVSMSSPSSNGFLFNIRTMERGRFDFILNSTGLSAEAVEGVKPFEKKFTRQRGFLPWVQVPYHVYVLPASGINSYADMRGKRVNAGPKGSQGDIISKAILEAAGLLKSVSLEYMNYTEAGSALTDNRVAISIEPVPMPSANILKVATVAGGIRILPITGEVAQKTMALLRGRHPMVIPAGTYMGVDKPVETIGHTSFIVVRDDVPAEMVYKILVKILSDAGRSYLPRADRSLENIFKLLPGFPVFAAAKVRLHPGVERYWKEKGVEIPADLRSGR